MNPVVAKAKTFAFTGTGAAIGAMAGGPPGLVVGAGFGALMDWWRKKNAPPPPISATIVPPVPALQMLPIKLQRQPYSPQTLDALTNIRKIVMRPAPPPPPKKKKAPPPPPPPPPPVSSSADASVNVDASASFTL